MIQLISATKGNLQTTLLHNSVGFIHPVAFSENNTDPLPVVYNDAIDDFQQTTEWLVFVHDDVIIEAPEALERQLDVLGHDFDVVGCAGTREAKLQEPALWHLMGDRLQHRGAVAHLSDSTGKKFMTSFGSYPDRVILIDGVFMAVKTEVFNKVRFDTTNPASFHFYDLSFSFDCHIAGFKVGVGDITITHASPGLREFSEDWKKGERWFLDKYRKLLFSKS
jgi:hypothetical protein